MPIKKPASGNDAGFFCFLRIIFLLFCILPTVVCVVGQKQILVFESGTNGFNTFRIPAIIQLPDKTLLAFCEGRVNGAGDFGNIKIGSFVKSSFVNFIKIPA